MTKGEKQIIEIARRVWQRDGEIEVDGDARVIASTDGGSYVEAWVWVSNETLDVHGYVYEGEDEEIG